MEGPINTVVCLCCVCGVCVCACPDGPERLKHQQLVCSDAVTGPGYREVEWTAELHPVVTEIRRADG